MRDFIKTVIVLFVVYIIGVVSGCISTQRYYQEHLELNQELLKLEIKLLKQQLKKYET